AGPQVVAFAALTGEHWIRIAGAEVIQIQIRIVGARQPRHAAAARHRVLVGPRLRTWLTWTRRRVPPPHDVAAFRVARFEKTGNVERVTADADDHVTADHDRRRR